MNKGTQQEWIAAEKQLEKAWETVTTYRTLLVCAGMLPTEYMLLAIPPHVLGAVVALVAGELIIRQNRLEELEEQNDQSE